MAAVAILKNHNNRDITTTDWPIFAKFGLIMQIGERPLKFRITLTTPLSEKIFLRHGGTCYGKCNVPNMNLETSNLVHWFIIASPTLTMKIFPECGVVRVRRPVLEFYTPCYISATANARDFEFCTWVGHAKYQSCDEWVFPKWAWSGSREQFLHCGLRKFRHSKSSVYRWYTTQTKTSHGRPVYKIWSL